jgi:hypothetical protein
MGLFGKKLSGAAAGNISPLQSWLLHPGFIWTSVTYRSENMFSSRVLWEGELMPTDTAIMKHISLQWYDFLSTPIIKNRISVRNVLFCCLVFLCGTTVISRVLSFVMWRSTVWQKFTDILEDHTASSKEASNKHWLCLLITWFIL